MIDINSEPFRGEETFDGVYTNSNGKEHSFTITHEWCDGAESNYTIYWFDEDVYIDESRETNYRAI